MEIIKLKPIIKSYLWGEERWDVSTIPEGLCLVGSGEYAGLTLKEALTKNPDWIGETGLASLSKFAKAVRKTEKMGFTGLAGAFGVPEAEWQEENGELPVLIKRISAKQPLSLQVHPHDNYALRNEGSKGKNEMWYIASAAPGAEIILGLEEPLSKDELRRLLERGEILKAARKVKVKKGDCYLIPAGLLHSIGAGMEIIEVQQPSNITYRVYDYGRKDQSGKPRELHIEKAFDVLDTSAKPQKAGGSLLADWEYFRCELIENPHNARLENAKGSRSETLHSSNGLQGKTIPAFECLTITGGSAELSYGKNQKLTLSDGETALIPAPLEGYTLKLAPAAKAITVTV